MALKPCLECKREVSTDAKTCPHCGKSEPTRVISRSAGCFLFVVGALFLSIVASQCDKKEESPAERDARTLQEARADRGMTMQFATQDAVRGMLKDPESAKFDDITYVYHGDTLAVCGHVNARNGFGGYAGSRAFIGYKDSVLINPPEGSNKFSRLWKRVCMNGR